MCHLTQRRRLHQPRVARNRLASWNTIGGKITLMLSTCADFSFCWHFWCSESCFAHIFYWCQSTLSIFTCQKRGKTLFQCPKDLAPVKDIHLTLTVGLWQLEDVVFKSRACWGWGGEEKDLLSREILCFYILKACNKKRLYTHKWRGQFQLLFTRSMLLQEKGVGLASIIKSFQLAKNGLF